MKTCRRRFAFVLLLSSCAVVGCKAKPRARPLRIVVTDPLAEPFACDCTPPSLRRNYGELGEFLEERLQRPARIIYAEGLQDGFSRAGGEVDLVIGKRSVILYEAKESRLVVQPIAMLTDSTGSTQVKGVFVVHSGDPAVSVSDIEGYSILLGPKAAAEKHQAAIEKLRESGVAMAEPIQTSPRCTIAALAVCEKEADAAVISSYAVACLEGGKIVPKGALRVVGETAPVPFIAVFAASGLSRAEETAVTNGLMTVRSRPSLLSDLLSKEGFVTVRPWRGTNEERASTSCRVVSLSCGRCASLWPERP